MLCIMDVFTKYALVKPIKRQKGQTVLNGFIEIVTESKIKSNKLWMNQGKKIFTQKWLYDHDILIHSTHSEKKWVVAERFLRTVKNKSYEK